MNNFQMNSASIVEKWPSRFWRDLPSRILVFTFFVAVFYDVFGGFLRFTFSLSGLTPLIYLPKVLMALALLTGIIIWMQKSIKAINSIFVSIIAIFALAFVTGALNDLPFLQMIFGFSIFMPLLFGMQVGLLEVNWLKQRLIWFAFGSVAFGIFLNYAAGDLPWTGSSYSVGGVVVEANRSWTHAEFSRLSGFSRISAQAAIQVAGLGLMVYAFAVKRHNDIWLGLGILMTSLIAVLLTTTKSALLALVILILVLPIRRTRMLAIFMTILFLTMVCMPIVAYIFNISLDYSNTVTELLLSSFDERLIYTWPITFGLIEQYGISGLGIGMGGVGTPSKTLGILEEGSALAGNLGLSYTDNLALYLYGNLGFLGVFLLLILVKSTYRLCRSSSSSNKAIGYASGCLLICGLTVDMMEMLFAPVIFGVCLGMAYRSSRAALTMPRDLR